MVLQGSSSMASASGGLYQCMDSETAASPTHFEDHRYALQWDGRNRNTFFQFNGLLPSIQSIGEQTSRSVDLLQDSLSENSELGRRRNLMNLDAGKESDNRNFGSAQGQGLSLTLGSNISYGGVIPSFYNRQNDPHMNFVSSSYLIDREELREVHSPVVRQRQMRDDLLFCGGDSIDNIYAASSHSGSTSHGVASFTTAIRNSIYLKPVQSLLDEVVNVRSTNVDFGSEKQSRKGASVGRTRWSRREALGVSTEAEHPANHHQGRHEFCLSSSNHDIRTRIMKLIALLDEVQSRYTQYYHQMEEVVSSFEVVAGLGSAKSYTVLALQAMSRHFRCLKDSITSQIQVAQRKLSEDVTGINGGLSQLSLFDQNAGQKRAAFHPLGMIQIQQAWRPLRGLPESSVAVLRAWLFEHFLHPYPSDSEKLMLASQTSLTKNQVSNWFINARVRLWKPMIEEMYREETSEASIDSNPLSNNISMTGKDTQVTRVLERARERKMKD